MWNVNVDNIVISKLVKTKTNFKYLIGYLDKDGRPLVLTMPKIIFKPQNISNITIYVQRKSL